MEGESYNTVKDIIEAEMPIPFYEKTFQVRLLERLFLFSLIEHAV